MASKVKWAKEPFLSTNRQRQEKPPPTHASILGMTGGFCLGAVQYYKTAPQFLFTFKRFAHNQKHLEKYLREELEYDVPTYVEPNMPEHDKMSKLLHLNY